MRKYFICVLMMTLLLSACGGPAEGGDKNTQLALTIRGEYLAAAGFSCRLDLTADYGRRVYTYTLDVQGTEEELSLTVAAPEEAAGVTARIFQGESTLEYDGLVLETGPLPGDGLTPLEAVPALLEAARSGYIDSCTPEKLGERETLRVLCRDPNLDPGQGRLTTLWFDADTHELVRGELAWEGRRTILCEFAQFSLA